MFNNSAIASAIRLGKLESIDNVILTNRAEGMYTLDESIKRLLRAEAHQPRYGRAVLQSGDAAVAADSRK